MTESNEGGSNFWHPAAGECWACLAIARRVQASIVLDTGDVVALLNPFPLSPGHALIVPREHVRNVYELPEPLAGPTLALAARVARAAKVAFAADGITLRQNNDAASDQHLFHFHLHVIPRFTGDEERYASTPQEVSRDELEAATARLRAALFKA